MNKNTWVPIISKVSGSVVIASKLKIVKIIANIDKSIK